MKGYIGISVFTVFVNDWGKYVKENKIEVFTREAGYVDVKIMGPQQMPLKECRHLNKQLGINRLNYLNNTHGFTTHKELMRHNIMDLKNDTN
jgi:hypothetical protein